MAMIYCYDMYVYRWTCCFIFVGGYVAEVVWLCSEVFMLDQFYLPFLDCSNTYFLSIYINKIYYDIINNEQIGNEVN